MSATNEYLRNNAAYAERFSGPLQLPPARHVAVIRNAGEQQQAGQRHRVRGDDPLQAGHRRVQLRAD